MNRPLVLVVVHVLVLDTMAWCVEDEDEQDDDRVHGPIIGYVPVCHSGFGLFWFFAIRDLARRVGGL